MFSVFKNYIENRVNITEQELQLVESVCKIKKLRKKQYLLQQGDVWKYYAFILEGCLRTYLVDEKGLEHVINFAIENWWAGDTESIFTGEPAKLNVDAIEDSVILLMKKEDFEMLCKEIPVINEMMSNIMEKNAIASQKRIHAAISYTAQEKYLNFVEQYPDFVLRIPQHMIASYLGISAETLSRVRKQSLRHKWLPKPDSENNKEV